MIIQSMERQRISIITALFSFFFSLMFCAGVIIERNESINYYALGFNTMSLAVIICHIFKKINFKVIKYATNVSGTIRFEENDRLYFFKVFLITVISYLVVFLAYFPGLNNYDAYSQVWQGVTSGYSQSNPVLYTLYLKFFLWFIGGNLFKNYTLGWALGILVQIIIFAISISYMHLLIYRLNIGRGTRLLLIMFYSLNPIFPIMAMSTTKDILYSSLFLLASTVIAYKTINPEIDTNKSIMVVFWISWALLPSLRNNAIISIALVLVIGTTYLYKKKNKKFAFHLILATVTGILFTQILNTTLSAEPSPRTKNDMLSMAYQQMAYTYKRYNNTLTISEKEIIEKYIPAVEKYNPQWADLVKDSGRATKDIPGFLKLYAQLGLKFPLAYLYSFYNQNIGYFYLLDTNNAKVQGDQGSRWGGVMETELRNLKSNNELVEEIVFKKHSFLPWLEELYEWLLSYNHYQDIFGLFVAISLSTYFWIIIYFFTVSIILKNGAFITNGANILGVLLGLLLSPMALVRYALPIIMVFPVAWCNIIYSKKGE